MNKKEREEARERIYNSLKEDYLRFTNVIYNDEEMTDAFLYRIYGEMLGVAFGGFACGVLTVDDYSAECKRANDLIKRYEERWKPIRRAHQEEAK